MADESSKQLQWILQEKTAVKGQDSEAEAYWLKVKEELKKRENSLKQLNSKIRSIESELKRLSTGRLVNKGNALLISLAANYKTSLRKKLEKLYQKRHSLEEDIDKARERKKIAEEEMRLSEEEAAEKEGLDETAVDSLD